MLRNPFTLILGLFLALSAIATVASADSGMHTSESATTKSASAVIDIDDHDFDTLIGSGEWLIEFYAPWCGYCSRFSPQYESLARDLAATDKLHHVKVARINVDKAQITSTRFLISRLPTIYHVHNKQLREVKGPFSKEQLMTMLDKKLWTQISPWHWTWSPFSFVGSVLWSLGWVAKALQTSIDFLKQFMPMWAVVGVGLVVVVALSVVFSFILPDPPGLKAAKAAAAAGPAKQGAGKSSVAATATATATTSGAAPARGSPATQARRRRD